MVEILSKIKKVIPSDETLDISVGIVKFFLKNNPTAKAAVSLVTAVPKVWKVLSEHRKLAEKQVGEVKAALKGGLCYEAALMSRNVYWDGSSLTHCGGWELSSEFQDLCYVDEKTGLRSKLYSRVKNGTKEYMYATAGTKTVNDWKHNILQIIGQSSQYEYSVENAKVLSERVKAQGGKLYFTGHSQGGGEAICNALATGCKAIVFNPAGVSPLTIVGQGSDKGLAEDVVTCFIADNDPLNIAQDALDKILGTGFPVSIGKRIYVKSTKATWESHLIEIILHEFSKQLPYDA